MEKVYWLVGSEENKKYETTTWFRCVGLEKFLDRVEEKNTIVAIIAEDNNIGFIVEDKLN
jgi:hypothetical protein